MSVETLAIVLHHSRASGTAKLVLIGIANHAGDGGAWPTVGTLARYANVRPRNVQKALERLVSLGEVSVSVQAGGTVDLDDYSRPNRYDVTVSCPPWCDRTQHHRDTRRLAGRQTRLPVENTGVGGVSETTGGVATDRGGVSLPTGEGVSLPTPKPSIEPDPPQVSASTTDRATTWPVDTERPPTPADPPADELAKVREALRTASEQHHRREHN